MKERITYIIRDPARNEFDPKQFSVSTDRFIVAGLDAIKEHSITIQAEQLPGQVWQVLRNVQELHIRWSTAQPYDTYAPYSSILVPGLHVFFSPLEGRSGKRLCPLLKDAFGSHLKCESVSSAFSNAIVQSNRTERWSARQYYSFCPSLQDLSVFLQTKICGQESVSCHLRARDLQKAQGLDIDYDVTSQALAIKVLWTRANGDDDKWYEAHPKPDGVGNTLEVGVLMNEDPINKEELRLSGFLTKVGQNSKPATTLFSMPARHHSLLPATRTSYKARFKTPTGLHPTLSLLFSSIPTAPAQDCALFAYFTLPSTLFFDKYAFLDPLALSSHSLRRLQAISGETDLEAPEWVVKGWGSAALFEIAVPEITTTTKAFQVTFPMHTRYLPPLNASSVLLSVPWPNVFWSCRTDQAVKSSSSPFDRKNVGYDALFDHDTIFYHLPPSTSVPRNVETVIVPVLDLTKVSHVDIGTISVIIAATIWITWTLIDGFWYHDYKR